MPLEMCWTNFLPNISKCWILHTQKVYTVFKDYMIINTYQYNSQPTLTISKLKRETVEQEAKYVQS